MKEGDKSPSFKGLNEKGEIVSSEDYIDKKLIIYFYPKDDTPGCTVESCNLRDNYGALQKLGYEILGVSADSSGKHQKFINKFQLPFSLISDTEKVMIRDFDVWGEKKFMGRVYDGILRTTFVIDEKGVINHIINKVKTKTHSEQIMDLISN